MKAIKLINVKPSKRKSEYLHKLSITKQLNKYTVFAITNAETFVPLRVGTLQQVIHDAEHCAAHFGLPIEHELNVPVDLIVQVHKKVAEAWLWTGQERKTYSDADQAYLDLRKKSPDIVGLEVYTEAANVKRVYTCSHNCNRPWMTILHRLQFAGELPEGSQAGECPRCFSHFVQSLEGGEFCLNCGHEQTRD